MSTAIAKQENSALAEMSEHVYSAMKNSLYPGAKDESVAMVWSYCKARNLDPLQKPVHIVPMWIKDSKTGSGEMRDVIMPGIGLYRIQAERSQAYAGQSEPEFGEDVTETLDNVTVTYPKWCKITVKKILPNGTIVEFTAKEFWKENYATAGKDKKAPNAMWLKRPYGQLNKCSEAQALRKAFPDIIDQSPTAEEMEGKHHEEIDITPRPTLEEKKVARAEASNNWRMQDYHLTLQGQNELKDFMDMMGSAKNLDFLKEIYQKSIKKLGANQEMEVALTACKDLNKKRLDEKDSIVESPKPYNPLDPTELPY